MAKKRKNGYTMNLLECECCGVTAEYGHGWAFFGNGKCKETKEEDYTPGTMYKFMTDHKWKKVGEKFVEC